MRQQEKALYDESLADLQRGQSGVKMALNLLNEYYARSDQAHDAAEGAAAGVVGLLEVIEADLSKSLALITSEESSAVQEYDRETKDNEIQRVDKLQDLKYKTIEAKQLDKSAAEETSDLNSVKEELAAVTEYLSRMEAECIAKPETYVKRKERREAEIAGLKEALSVLTNDVSDDEAFVQRREIRRTLRGSANVAAAH